MIVNFRDRNEAVCTALRDKFAGFPDVFVHHGDIFAERADCVVSPANSFGEMDGGIDAVYVARMGKHVEDQVKARIKEMPFGELLVGQSVCVETSWDFVPYMIAAPTMRIPGPTTAGAVFLAARAAFACARGRDFKTLSIPGLGTWSGCVEPNAAASAMRSGYTEAMKS